MSATPCRCSTCSQIAGPLAEIPDGRYLCPDGLDQAGGVSWEVPIGWAKTAPAESAVPAPIEPTPRKQMSLF
jgi:hypothetical protein